MVFEGVVRRECNTFKVYTSSYMSGTLKLREKALLYKVKAKKDPQAFGQLYDEYIDKMYRFIFFKVGTKEEAEDLTSDVFLKAWHYLTDERHVNVRSFSGLLYTIARSTLIDFYRKKSKRQEFDLEQIPDIQLVQEDHGLTAITDTIDVKEILVAIKTMKQNYQEVILLRYMDDLSISEIAEIIGKNNTATRVLLHRALKLLQQMVQKGAGQQTL